MGMSVGFLLGKLLWNSVWGFKSLSMGFILKLNSFGLGNGGDQENGGKGSESHLLYFAFCLKIYFKSYKFYRCDGL